MEKYLSVDDFDELASELLAEINGFTNYETLKRFAIHNIEEHNLNLAIHILEALWEEGADYYAYDYSMGTLDTPAGMHEVEDLHDFVRSMMAHQGRLAR